MTKSDPMENSTVSSFYYQCTEPTDSTAEPNGPMMVATEVESSNSFSTNISHFSRFATIFICVAVIIFAAISTTEKTDSVGTNTRYLNFVSRTAAPAKFTSTTSTSSKESGDDDDMYSSSLFKVQRVGYDTLPYFASDRSSIKFYKFLSAYDSIVEPYVNLTVDYSGSSDEIDYLWLNVRDSNDDLITTGKIYLESPEKSDYINVPCSAYDEIEVEVKVRYNKEWVAANKLKTICMYVRREIRELTASDLQETVTAMHTLWTTEESAGQKQYGKNYHSSTWFSSMHDFNAAWKDADHFHEGLGFLLQHTKMSNLFELSLQAVNPSVSLFFWDFTYDNSQGISLTDSPMFQDSTFGELRSPTDSYWGWTYRNDSLFRAQISSGLWAKAEAEPTQYDDLKNGFGYMRGPWNMNPSKYVSRFTNPDGDVPTCLTYYNWLSESDFSAYMQQAGYGPHASTHGTVGGVYGCDMMDGLREAGLIDAKAQLEICTKWGFYIKELYRAEFIKPQKDCEANSHLDFDSISCGFTCEDDEMDDMITFIKDSLTLKLYVADGTDDDDWASWRDFICTGDGYRIFVGDHLESASPNDPSFWPIHPTQDRLLQLKLMTGGFDDFTWPTDASKTGDYVCNHAKCYNYLKYGDEKDYYSYCCAGHFENDQLFDFISGDRTKSYGPTNREILDAVDAAQDTYSVPYIYSHFNWEHCDQDFDGLVEMLSIKMSTKEVTKDADVDEDEDEDKDKDEDKDDEEDKDEDKDKDKDEDPDEDKDEDEDEEKDEDKDEDEDEDEDKDKDEDKDEDRR